MAKKLAKMSVTVEKSADGTFGCYPENEFMDFGVAGYGHTAEEAIADFKLAYREIREEYAKLGKTVPNYELRFKYDIKSFFDYFDCFNVKVIAKKAGINYSQLNQYLTGHRNAGRSQYEKLSNAIREITADLEAATF